MPPTTDSTSSEHSGIVRGQTLVRTLAIVAILVLISAAVFAWTKWMKRSSGPEPLAAPTVESFRKNYVEGCELGATTFNFSDGAKLTGEFASCPVERNISFFATTTSLRVSGKDPITVHTIMVDEGGTRYPVASVYMKLPQGVLDVMFGGVKLASTTPESLGITPSMMSMADIQANATSSENFTILRGYVIGMYLKSTGGGYWFDQSSLMFSPN